MPDPYNPVDDARQGINAQVSEMWYNSPLRRGIKAVQNANESVGNYADQMYKRLMNPPPDPGFVGPPDPYQPDRLQSLLMSMGLSNGPPVSTHLFLGQQEAAAKAKKASSPKASRKTTPTSARTSMVDSLVP